MSTTITYGSQVAVIEHPRDLRGRGWPIPPMQPVANWATTLAQFEALCTASRFREAIEWLATEYCLAGITDVPSGARAAFKAWMQANVKTKPECLTGAGSDWRTDGREF